MSEARFSLPGSGIVFIVPEDRPGMGEGLEIEIDGDAYFEPFTRKETEALLRWLLGFYPGLLPELS